MVDTLSLLLAASRECWPSWLRRIIPHVAQSPADGRAHCGESCTGLLSRLGKSLLSLFVSAGREEGREREQWRKEGRRGEDIWLEWDEKKNGTVNKK